MVIHEASTVIIHTCRWARCRYIVCLFFVCLYGYDFSASATGVDFSWRFIGIQGRKFPIFVKFALQKPKIGRRIGQRAHWTINRMRCAYVTITLGMRRSWIIARHVDVGSACVDRGQSPLTYLFVQVCHNSYTTTLNSCCMTTLQAVWNWHSRHL